jgi:general stress protein YciG
VSTNAPRKKPPAPHGFARMTPERRREIAAAGGRASHAAGTSHRWTPKQAGEAGKIGGKKLAEDREHMAEIGRKGVEARRGRAAITELGKAALSTYEVTETGKAALSDEDVLVIGRIDLQGVDIVPPGVFEPIYSVAAEPTITATQCCVCGHTADAHDIRTLDCEVLGCQCFYLELEGE